MTSVQRKSPCFVEVTSSSYHSDLLISSNLRLFLIFDPLVKYTTSKNAISQKKMITFLYSKISRNIFQSFCLNERPSLLSSNLRLFLIFEPLVKYIITQPRKPYLAVSEDLLKFCNKLTENVWK